MMPSSRSSESRVPTGRALRWLALLLVTTSFVDAAAITLRVGEMTIMRPGDIERVAVGNAEFISTSLLKNGQLLVFGEAPGTTTLHLWLRNGQESDLEFTVEGSEYASAVNSADLQQKAGYVRQLLADVPGIQVEAVSDRIVLTGEYDSVHSPHLNAVKAVFAETLDLTASTRLAEVKALLGHIGGIDIKLVGGHFVLTGTVDTSVINIIETVKGQYSEIMDLTLKDNIDIADTKMVLMNVKITEFNKSATDNLGINWTTNFAGPAAAFAAQTEYGAPRIAADALNNSVLQGAGVPGQLAGINTAGLQPSFGYFGIATEITSRINVAVSSGDALILAEPRLVARSGGEASFLAGGEVPIEIVTPTSATIEFKQFGILLNIKPEIDMNDNILANVETEISAVDQSVAVGNTPGFLTRRTTADIQLKSGETLVMSGLVDRELGRDSTGVKGLESIPILGALFRSRAYRDSKTDLVIFVTPVVYSAGDQQNIEAIAREKEQVDGFIESMSGSSFQLLD